MCAKVSKVQIKKIETKNRKKDFNKKTLKNDKFKNKIKDKTHGFKNESKVSKKKKDEPRIKEIFQYKPPAPFNKEKNRKKILKVLNEALKMNFGKNSKNENKKPKTETPENGEAVRAEAPKSVPAEAPKSVPAEAPKAVPAEAPKAVPAEAPKAEATSPKKKKNKKKSAKESGKEQTEESAKVEGTKTPKEIVTNNTESEPKKPKSPVENTIFVGNIPANTKKVQLMKLFAKCGKVLSVRFRTLDGKRLFKHKIRKEAQALNAYIVLDSAKAIGKSLELSGTEFKGNHIRVDRAKGKEGRQVELKSVEEEKLKAKRSVFVGNLKYSATDEKLHGIFSSCGEVEYVRTIQSEKGCKGIAYVCYKKPESVTLALELNNTLVDDRPMRVERCSKEKSDKLKENKEKMAGAARRVLEKNKKNDGKNQKQKQTKKNKKGTDDGEQKKTPFKGVKSDKIKKNKKKKKMPEALKLAKKLSPGGKKQKSTSKD